MACRRALGLERVSKNIAQDSASEHISILTSIWLGTGQEFAKQIYWCSGRRYWGTVNTKEDQNIIRMGWIVFRTGITEMACNVTQCYFLTMKCYNHVLSSYLVSSNNSSPDKPGSLHPLHSHHPLDTRVLPDHQRGCLPLKYLQAFQDAKIGCFCGNFTPKPAASLCFHSWKI